MLWVVTVPINASAEYFEAEKRYLEAKNREEKIAALEEMIRKSPKHKGAHNLLADLKKRLSKLKTENKSKASSKPRFSIRKEGAAQICIIGLTNSGKSTLLNALTNAHVEVGDYEYTTKEPRVGMMLYDDMQFQLIEIPSSFDSESVGLIHSCDLILVLLDSTRNIDKQKKELMKFLEYNRLDSKRLIFVKNKSKVCGLDQSIVCIDAQSKIGMKELKEKIWNTLNLIKIYAKSPNKPKAIPALALKRNSTVSDLAKEIHKDFLETFKFARIFNSTKFSGKKVGLDYKLHDNDIVEIHTE
ncbi:MAG: 50S ribosome-binding GTPase [Candidatus Aenigmarchaeota archaeon]|nr:50S ribosome-binding GTPase [Candidatus Aenigmarchaeota archaeon]